MRVEDVEYVENLILTMVRATVDHEDAVTVTRLVGHVNVTFEVYVDDRDMRFALGRDGDTVAAMRVIINTACKKFRIKYAFTILPREPA